MDDEDAPMPDGADQGAPAAPEPAGEPAVAWRVERWMGPPETVTAALRALGWFGPSETPEVPRDARVGGFLPAPGAALLVLDGVAYAMIVSTEAIPRPEGIDELGPELALTLLGSF